MCQAALEMDSHGVEGAGERAVELARRVMARQISKSNPEAGFYGHFKEFDTIPHTEKAWSHGIVDGEFGADMGGIYPNYLMPLMEMRRRWPAHDDADDWLNTLQNFTFGYLIPACKANPFYIVPLGIFGDEGPIWFAGTFHGTNTIYGYTAALALELKKLFDEPILEAIAYGNLQWLAGLNSGITKENMQLGCVVYSTELPAGRAYPVSMICGIGHRWGGTWFQTRGVICNGFSTGEQFKYDVAPVKANDGPFSLTDEDWIPHSAGWITGLTRLYSNS
jgi:hypothetical protein